MIKSYDDLMKAGGWAFPVDERQEQGRLMDGILYYGMTLRDWFAGQALSAAYVEKAAFIVEDIAEVAYRIADAMLAEREKEDESD